MAVDVGEQVDAGVPALLWPEPDTKADFVLLINRRRTGILNLQGQAAVDFSIAFVPLMLVMMAGSVIKDKLPASAGDFSAPLAVERAFLAADLAVDFKRVGKIRIEFQLQLKLNRLQGEDGQVQVFVQALAGKARDENFQGL